MVREHAELPIRLLSLPARAVRGIVRFATRSIAIPPPAAPPRATFPPRRSAVDRRDPRDVGVPPHARRNGHAS